MSSYALNFGLVSGLVIHFFVLCVGNNILLRTWTNTLAAICITNQLKDVKRKNFRCGLVFPNLFIGRENKYTVCYSFGSTVSQFVITDKNWYINRPLWLVTIHIGPATIQVGLLLAARHPKISRPAILYMWLKNSDGRPVNIIGLTRCLGYFNGIFHSQYVIIELYKKHVFKRILLELYNNSENVI